jgi:uncharacterized membrane protein YdjX (TVP38/TMEM64 family)
MEPRRRQVAAVALLGALALVGALASGPVRAEVVALLVGPLFLPVLAVAALIRPFLAWPLSLLSVSVGYVLGFPVGVPVVLGVTVLTCLPPFLLAERLATDAGPLGRLARTGEEAVAVTGGLRGMVAARLSPAPADAVSYGAGFAGVSLPAFVAGTVLGELPWAAFYVLLGGSLDALSTGRPTDAGPPLALLAGAALLAAALVAGPVARTLR